MSPRLPIRLLGAQSDQRLVALVAQGHERAFEALVHRYRRPLLRYCKRLGLADSRAEDVIQHALMKAWLALSEGREVRELRPWLYRVVHNAAVNAMTRGAQAQAHVQLSDAVAPALDVDPGARLAVRETLDEVARLPELQRDALVMSAIAGCDHDEVASALGVSSGAVRGLLYRARTTLRSAAAALTPQSLLGWIARGEGVPGAERPAELAAGATGAGMASGLIKGALLAATAGVLATGAAVVHSHSTHRARSAGTKASAAVRASVATPAASSGLVVAHGARPAAASGLRRSAAGSTGRRRSRARLGGPVGAPLGAPLLLAPRPGAGERHRGDRTPGGRDGGLPSGGGDREGLSSGDVEQRSATDGTSGSGDRSGAPGGPQSSEPDGSQTPSGKDATSTDGGSDGSGDGSGTQSSSGSTPGGGGSLEEPAPSASPSVSEAEPGH